MGINSSTLLRNVGVAAGVFALAGSVQAGVPTSGATVLDSGTFIINSITSSLAYNPGSFSFGAGGSFGPGVTVDYTISGSFDVTIWTLDNGTTEWLSINNVTLSATNLPDDFQTPDFINSQLAGSLFSGDGNPCSNLPISGSCFSTGLFPTIDGQLQNGTISFLAFVPVGEAVYGGGSSYQINAASVVPIPAAFWLFTSVIGVFGFTARKKIIMSRKP
ncbi:MAG: hypothetical protein ACU836_10655 [Gammaproteobacteria bacterium]